MAYIHGTAARFAIADAKTALRNHAGRKITDTELAEMLDVRPLAIYRWQNGDRTLRGTAATALRAIARHPEDYVERKRED